MTYRVTCEWDGTFWFVRVPAIPGCHTQGRNLAEIQKRVREALSLFVEDAELAELDLHFVLPKGVRSLVHKAKTLRARADAAQAAATAELHASAAALAAQDLSYRDIGAVLGVSHQRVQQVLAETKTTRDLNRLRAEVERHSKPSSTNARAKGITRRSQTRP